MAKRTTRPAHRGTSTARPADAPAPAAAATATPFDLGPHRIRSGRAWTVRGYWQGLYDEAYEYAIPYRRPAARTGPGSSRIDRLFDNTAIVSTFRFAGQLQNDLFPPGQPFFKLAIGAFAEAMLKKAKRRIGKVALARELEAISAVAQGFFLSSEWDNAVHETCIDLAAGTGGLLIVEGDDDRPCRFVNVPFDEIAIEAGPYNDTAGIFWKTRMTRRQIKEAFPRGTFDARFEEAFRKTPDAEIDLHQDFVREGRIWRFLAYTRESTVPINNTAFRSQPMAVPRYFRVPGEPYGRGPVLLALPTIKTLNKAMELTLKSAAIQMLGIWGYRPGGAFNPDTARISPGAFWAMQATGGVLGPDVTRMDVSAGKIDVANLMTQELRTQVQAALHDTQIGPETGTPKSATEIMARMKRISENYMGAFGRLVHEIIPVVVRRVIEIAYNKGLISHDIPIDELLIRIDVLSPIAAALKAQALSTIIEFAQLVGQLRGAEAVELTVKLDEALQAIGLGMGVPAEFLLTEEERAALEEKIKLAAAALGAAQQNAAAPAEGEGTPMPMAA